MRATCRPLALLTLTVALVLPTVPAGAASEDLRLGTPQLSPDRVLTVDATVPTALAGAALPTGAITATQDGRPLPLTADRVVDSPIEVVVAVDTSVDAETLVAEQSAAADLLRALPPETPTTLLPGGEPTTGRSALDKVGELQPGTAALLDGLPDAPLVPRFVVLLTGCTALTKLRAPVWGDQTVTSVLATGGSCLAAAQQVAGPRAGTVRTNLPPMGLLAGVDEVVNDVLGRYSLSTGPGIGSGPVEITVTGGGTSAAAIFDLPPAATASPVIEATYVGTGSSRRGPMVAAGVLAAGAVAGLALALLSRRRDQESIL